MMFTIKKNKKAQERIKRIWKEYIDKKTEKDYTSIYVHVPYCTQKCRYCEYFSKVTCSGIPDSCIDYLEQQFEDAAPVFKDELIKAINFGGGTPNVLSPAQLDRVLNMIRKYWNLQISDENEMGFEFHPYHLSEEHIAILKNSYINRLSMGIQTFNKDIIDIEKRLYVSKERMSYIYNTVKSFAKIVNVDLLAGLIDQTFDVLLDDVKTLLDIGVEALTIYELNRVNGRKNKESERAYITSMLLDVHKKYGNFPNYRYVGTTEEGFMHCNRFYKNVNMFLYPYNPAPQGYNSVVAFSIDDDIKIYPYSHFIPTNKAYQRLGKNITSFYSLDKRLDRPWWRQAFEVRNNKFRN